MGVFFMGIFKGFLRIFFFIQSKTLILSTDLDIRSLETKFLIAICRPTGDR